MTLAAFSAFVTLAGGRIVAVYPDRQIVVSSVQPVAKGGVGLVVVRRSGLGIEVAPGALTSGATA
ncbi:hypothetical protein ACFYNY_19965 [Streptomyces sp. NPDC006530]|uniref:hypothetical protein n=1 Tax=Streptomyces sp. NPDC006530 TaxID=3364750 RepID=UPI0036CA83B9